MRRSPVIALAGIALACGSRAPAAPPAEVAATAIPAERLASPPAPPLLSAGGVVGCASLDGVASCWGSWGDDVPAGIDFDPAAPRALPVEVVELAPGWTHTCARHDDGAVACSGSLGAALRRADAAWIELESLAGARRIASGRGFVCAIGATGSLACVTERVYPELATAPGGLELVAATTSGWQLCVASASSATCWASLDHRAERIALPEPPVDLALAPDLGCARSASGSVHCWTAAGTSWSAPVRLDVLADALVAMHDRVCARDGDEWSCWHGGAAPRPWTSMRGALGVAAGMGFVCGLWEDEPRVRCVGDDTYGQLGPYGAADASTGASPRRTVAIDVAHVAMGAAHACLVYADGTVACWGDNTSGQLGDGTAIARADPAPVRGLSGVVQISAGRAHTCARTERGDVWCWGQMALDHGEDVEVPPLALGSRPRRRVRDATDLASGADHACARVGDELRCFGSRWAIGDPDPGTTAGRGPIVRVALPPGARTIAAGGEETCAIAGELFCFGSGRAGAAGDPTFAAVTDLLGVALVVPGGTGCAVLGGPAVAGGAIGGEVRCWGRNTRGEVGDGTRSAREGPVHVELPEDAVAVSLGDLHACALVRSGAVWCWGAGDLGELGVTPRGDRRAPTAVPGLADVIAIAAGGASTCALRADGHLECWGSAYDEDSEADAGASFDALFE